MRIGLGHRGDRRRRRRFRLVGQLRLVRLVGELWVVGRLRDLGVGWFLGKLRVLGNVGTSGGDPGAPITCASPGSYKKNGGPCGSERWDVKTGKDTAASTVSLVPKSTTIATLTALPANKPTAREAPTETTLWELTDVTLTTLKLETDSDYHLVVSDGASSMIVEIPYPSCATASAWSCFTLRPHRLQVRS